MLCSTTNFVLAVFCFGAPFASCQLDKNGNLDVPKDQLCRSADKSILAKADKSGNGHHICYINDPGVGPLAINLTYSTGPSTKNPAKPPINPLIDSLKTQLSGISLEDSKSQYPLRPLLNSTQANTIFRLQPYPCNGQLTPTKTTNTTQVIRQSVFDHLDVALDNIRVLLTKPFGKGLVYAYGEIFALQKAIELAPQPVPIEIKWTGTPGTDWYAEGRFDVLGEGEGNPRGDITGEENFDCATG